MAANIPDIDVDLYEASSLLAPYENYRMLRDAAPIVRLPCHDLYVMARFHDVQASLQNWQVFSSARGIGMNDAVNASFGPSTLTCDEPVHARRRTVLTRPLSPASLAKLRARIEEEAEKLVDRLVERRSFDASKDLATHLPLTIVYDLLGLPEVSPEEILDWSAGGFDALGPAGNPRTEAGMPRAMATMQYAQSCTREAVKPGGWAAGIFDAMDEGAVLADEALAMIFDYLGPSLDTTILATTNAIMLFAQNPDQWAQLRANPARIPNAINEVVRLERPIQGFSRFVTEDIEIGDQHLHAGARVVMLFGSANRDERRWEKPERFDILRSNADHVGFGHGVHTCAGANLARLEISALLKSLISRVERFEVEDAEPLLNNTLRGYDRIDLTVVPA